MPLKSFCTHGIFLVVSFPLPLPKSADGTPKSFSHFLNCVIYFRQRWFDKNLVSSSLRASGLFMVENI